MRGFHAVVFGIAVAVTLLGCEAVRQPARGEGQAAETPPFLPHLTPLEPGPDPEVVTQWQFTGGLAMVVSADGVIYNDRGRLVQTVAGSLPRTLEAAASALRRTKLPVQGRKAGRVRAYLDSEYPDGKKVWIGMEGVAGSQTRVVILVGAEGDSERAFEILEAIKGQLQG